jgi:hypothetical protein
MIAPISMTPSITIDAALADPNLREAFRQQRCASAVRRAARAPLLPLFLDAA